jgi:dihydropteroate synthase
MTRSEFDTWLVSIRRRRLIMGVLNVTPDSFSDGGQFTDIESAVERGVTMAAEGAELIDVGGESTRPGSEPVGADEQVARVVPIIRAVRERTDAVISVDTGLAAVAEAAIDSGANVINDIYGGTQDPGLLELAARRGVPVILMHMQGRPATMQVNPQYGDVMREAMAFLAERVEAAVATGVARDRILIDPGIGFGKTLAHNLELLRRLGEMRSLGRPVVVGVSRKGFIGKVTGESIESGRPFGTAGAVVFAATNGAEVLRVHDVAGMSQVVRMIEAIQNSGQVG